MAHTTDASEIEKLRESLRLCQLELANVREEQEQWAERLAPLEYAHTRFVDLTTRLDAWLTEQEQVPASGWRGRLKHRIVGLPTEQEQAELEQLRSTPLFDGAWYLREYPNVIGTGLSSALHYLRRGAKNGRNPGPDFDTQAYFREHPDLPGRTNPLLHYLRSKGTTAAPGTQ